MALVCAVFHSEILIEHGVVLMEHGAFFGIFEASGRLVVID